MANQLLTYVRSNPGEGLESIGKGLGLPTKELKLPVQKLLASKSVRTTGQKRGTKYFASGRAFAARTASANGRRKGRRKKARRRGRK